MNCSREHGEGIKKESRMYIHNPNNISLISESDDMNYELGHSVFFDIIIHI